MKFFHDGLTLYFDAPDAPAPAARVPGTAPNPMTIGVAPPNVANTVNVRYRIDEGPIRQLPAHPWRTDYSRGIQYFVARFPASLQGHRVEYCPVANCGGRQVPAHGREEHMLASFLLPKPVAATAVRNPPQQTAPNKVPSQPSVADPTATPAGIGPPSRKPGTRITPRFIPDLEFMGQITVRLKPPTVFGATPMGLRVDFYALGGTLETHYFTAAVYENSVDYMIVRPDGIGQIDIHATLKTEDGALLTANYYGLIDFGEDGYQRMLTGNYPHLPRHQVAPRVLTSHPRYAWMNRTQFLGVGHVRMKELLIEYDLFAVRTLLEPSWEGGR